MAAAVVSVGSQLDRGVREMSDNCFVHEMRGMVCTRCGRSARTVALEKGAKTSSEKPHGHIPPPPIEMIDNLPLYKDPGGMPGAIGLGLIIGAVLVLLGTVVVAGSCLFWRCW